jgi:hypothetical protein
MEWIRWPILSLVILLLLPRMAGRETSRLSRSDEFLPIALILR